MAESYYSHQFQDDPAAKRQRAGLAHVLRSPYPSQWTEDRGNQSRHDKGDVYRAIRAKANAVSGVTVQITRPRKGKPAGRVTKALPTPHAHANDEQMEPVLGGRLVRLFESPNARETFADLLVKAIIQTDLTGTFLLWGNVDGVGRPVELFALPTALCLPQPASSQYPRGCYRVMPYYAGTGLMAAHMAGVTGAVIPAEQVMRFMLPGALNYWDGYSPLSAIDKWVDAVEQIDLAFWASMDRGVHAGETIILPGASQAEIDEKYESILRQSGGAANFRKMRLLGTNDPTSKPEIREPGPNKDMEFQAGRKVYGDLIADAYGVPPSIFGTEATYSALYAAKRQFRENTLVPFLTRFAAWLTREVMPRWGATGAKLQIDLPPLDDPDLLEKRLSADSQTNTIYFNEYRRARNMPPHPDPRADTLPVGIFTKLLEQETVPPPQQPGMPGGDPSQGGGEPAEQDPDELLAGLVGDGGPTAGAVPGAENPESEGTGVPQVKAFDPEAVYRRWVEKAARAKAGAGKHEGEVWEKNGRYWTLKNGRTVPAKRPGADAERAQQRAAAKDQKGQQRQQAAQQKQAAKAAAKDQKVAGKTAATHKALDAAKQALADAVAGKGSAVDPADLAAHLKTLTVAHLTQLKRDAGFRGGKLKSELAQKFIDHVKGLGAKAKDAAAKKPEPEPEDFGPLPDLEADDDFRMDFDDDAPSLGDHMAAMVAAAEGLSGDQKAKYTAAAHRVAATMPPHVAAQVAKGLKQAHFYASSGHLVDAMIADPSISEAFRAKCREAKAKGHMLGGVCQNGDTLHLDGDTIEYRGRHGAAAGTAAGIYAHEMTHIIDKGYALSGSDEWQAAHEAEIMYDRTVPIAPLTAYAATATHEGFAEFGRLLYGSDVPTATIRKEFPKASAFFAARGLFPAERGGTGSKLNEVFDKRIPLDDKGGESHADTLLRPAAGAKLGGAT